MNSLYNKYGGFETIHSVVSLFYKKVLDSDNLFRFFENADIERIIEHQTRFFSQLLGGPQIYDSAKLSSLHQSLKINEDDFNEVVAHLKSSLEDSNVEKNDIVTILNAVGSYKKDIVFLSK